MSKGYRRLKKKSLIGIYKKLLKQDRVKQRGAAYHRMRQLELKNKQQTRWLGIRYQNCMPYEYRLAKKDLN
tara:strand:- start:320 stop:532 length:213 start_codon:yes stop_codon:yes gene_type:complete